MSTFEGIQVGCRNYPSYLDLVFHSTRRSRRCYYCCCAR